MNLKIHNLFSRVAEGRASIRSETFKERMVLMVSWNDAFTFIIMLVSILTYIDNRRHKK